MKRLLAAALLPFLAGCAAAPAARSGDIEAQKTALMKVDSEFSKTAQERGLAEAFAAYAAPDATMMPGNQNPATGREAIRKQFADTPPQTTLLWKPFAADVSRAGDLGYTLGAYELNAKGPDGKATTHYGKYCSVWKRQPDGTWKWVVDIGNSSPAPGEETGAKK